MGNGYFGVGWEVLFHTGELGLNHDGLREFNSDLMSFGFQPELHVTMGL